MLLQRCCRPPHRAPPPPLPLPLLGPAAAAASREARDLAGGEGLETRRRDGVRRKWAAQRIPRRGQRTGWGGVGWAGQEGEGVKRGQARRHGCARDAEACS